MVERMRATPHAFVAQEWVRLSQAPTWSSERERFEPRVVGLRLYVVATATGYDVMPGGLARVSPETGTEVISMQRGGSSKDIWVLDGAATVYESLLQPASRRGISSAPVFILLRAPWRIFSGWDAIPSASNRLGGCCGPRRYGWSKATLQRRRPSRCSPPCVKTRGLAKSRRRPRIHLPGKSKKIVNGGDDWLLAAVGDPRAVNGLPANTARLLYCTTQLRDRISLDNWHTVQRLAHAHELRRRISKLLSDSRSGVARLHCSCRLFFR